MMAAAEQAKKKFPDFRPGDTIRVHIRVVEGDSERVQVFEGTCLGRRGRGDGASFTVRKVSFGVGVERTFPLFSPHIEKIEVTMSGKVRRAKLYYLRGLTGRAARLAEADRGTPGETAPAAPETPASGEASASAQAEKAEPAEAPARSEPHKSHSTDAKPGKASAVKAGSTAK